MTQSSLPELKRSITSNWWMLFVRGILLVFLGIYALLNPGLSLLAWALVAGVFLIADGLLAVVAGIAGWVETRGWTVIRGILAILAGVFAVWHPAVFGSVAGLTLVIVIASYASFGGIMEILVAIRERKAIEGEGWMVLSGIFSVFFGIALMLMPFIALGLFIRISGAFAVIFGIAIVYISLKARSFGRTLQ